MPDVFANNRSILHAGDGLTQTAGPPDVCKTPTPGGPVPIPYPNIAMDSDLAKGTKKVKINGNPVATEASNLSTSTGDEAGSAGGGIVSNKTKGKLTWGSVSGDVIAEGNGVARFMDVNQFNGNVFNTILTAMGEVTEPGYGDDPIDGTHCSICGKKKKKHRLSSDRDLERKIIKLRDDLAAPGGGFQSALRASNGKVRSKDGFMIGVLICQCEKEIAYAGISGNNPSYFAQCKAAFEAACGKDFIPVVAPRTPPPLTGLSTTGPFRSMSETKWKDVQARIDTVRATHGGPPPFVCAGPKMVQKCLAEGHKPGKMVEMWLPNVKATVEIRHRTILVRTRIDGIADRTEMRTQPTTAFGGSQMVPSCTTCQVQMTVMLCRLGLPPCPA
jgi:hypothetical protein